MEKITNRIYYQETRLPWRDKYLEELDNKSEDELICDFGHGFTSYSIALNMVKEKREKGEADFYYTKGVFNIIIPKYMNESYYERYKFGDEAIEDFYNGHFVTLHDGGKNTEDLLSDVDHDVYEIFVVYNHKYLVLHKTYDINSLSKSPSNPKGVDAYTGELREDILKVANEIIKDLKENPNPETEKGLF